MLPPGVDSRAHPFTRPPPSFFLDLQSFSPSTEPPNPQPVAFSLLHLHHCSWPASHCLSQSTYLCLILTQCLLPPTQPSFKFVWDPPIPPTPTHLLTPTHLFTRLQGKLQIPWNGFQDIPPASNRPFSSPPPSPAAPSAASIDPLVLISLGGNKGNKKQLSCTRELC